MRFGVRAGAGALLVGAFMAATAGTASAAGQWTPYQTYTSKSTCSVQASLLNLQAVTAGRHVEYACFEIDDVSPTLWGLYWRAK